MKIEFIFLCFVIGHIKSEFTLSRRPAPCEVPGTTLVEQFFNTIFTEFHQSPPSCVCVRMCSDHPTYCYPNGCFKKEEKKTDTPPVSRIQHGDAKMFLVENDKGFLADMMAKSISVAPVGLDVPDRPLKPNLIGQPNPYKDILFKHRKIPKLEMKYNLREQVKHTKERKTELDVSSTRWPTNQQLNRRLYKASHRRSSHYFTSVIPETNKAEASKYFKRYLTKRENQNGLDIGSLYLYSEASNFSSDPLIDNLIERTLAGLNSTSGSNITESNEANYGDNKDDSKLTRDVDTINNIIDYLPNDTSRSTDNNKSVLHQNSSREVNVVGNLSLRNTNENRYKDIADAINGTTTKMYFEMITKLSDQIDKNNNASLLAMKRFIGKQLDHIPKENISNIFNAQKSINNGSINEVVTTKYKPNIKNFTKRIKFTTDKGISREEFAPIINSQVKKSKQRILRKLRNIKLH